MENVKFTSTKLVVIECYGSAKSKKYRKAGKKIVDKLRSEYRVTREDLMDEIGVSSSKDFQRRISPLMNHDDGNLRCVVTSRQENGNTYYQLDRTLYDSWNNRIVQNVRNTIDSKPRKEIEELKDRIEELEKENKRLRDNQHKEYDMNEL